MGRNKLVKTDDIMGVINDLKDYHPLSIRQILYQIVESGKIPKDGNHYQSICRTIGILREDETIPWEIIGDRTRRLSYKRGYPNLKEYTTKVILPWISGYERCYVQDQEYFVEIWLEKDALAGIFMKTIEEKRYCVSVLPCRGRNSRTHIQKYLNRADEAIMRGQKPVLLYYGDHDPSGWNMFENYKKYIHEEHGRNDIKLDRIALNYEQVIEWELPQNPGGCKKSDKNYKKFVDLFGEMAIEIDALHPKKLVELIQYGLGKYLDASKFEAQRKIEELEIARIEETYWEVEDFLLAWAEKIGITRG